MIILHTVAEMKLSCFCMHLYICTPTPTLLLAAKVFLHIHDTSRIKVGCTFVHILWLPQGRRYEMQLKWPQSGYKATLLFYGASPVMNVDTTIYQEGENVPYAPARTWCLQSSMLLGDSIYLSGSIYTVKKKSFFGLNLVTSVSYPLHLPKIYSCINTTVTAAPRSSRQVGNLKLFSAAKQHKSK